HEVAVLGLTLPAVLTVHVEDEVRGHPAADHTAEDEAREEALARARLAEDAVAALHEAAQVQADRYVHVEWRAQLEAILALGAKDALEVALVGHEDRREVRWDRLH